MNVQPFKSVTMAIRYFISLLLLLSFTSSFSQDTTVMAQYLDGRKMLMIYEGSDTVISSFYPDGTKEYERALKNKKFNGKYTRWYQNGRLMWEQSITNNQREGKSIFWHDNGEKIAELRYENDTLTDTLFFSRIYTLVLGHGSTSSIVYGGMERVNDTISQQPSKGPMINKEMYVVKIKDKKTVPKIYRSFYTDQNGDFILCLPKGTYGFFPASYSPEKLQPGQASPQRIAGQGWNSSWSPTEPLVVDGPQIIALYLMSTFVGYAP